MRIRKGPRCLPLMPADSSLLQEGSVQRRKDVRVVDNGKTGPTEALVRLVAPVADIIGHVRGPQYQKRAKDKITERNECIEYDLEKNRVSADDNFNECSSMNRDTGVDATVTKLAETPSEERSLFTRHRPLDTSRTISCSTTSAIETRDQLDLLEQSLRHVCSRAGMSGLSARDAVAQIIEQGLPGLNTGGARLIEQVMKSFRNSSKFVECEEPGRYFLQESLAGDENKSLIVEDSEISDEKTVSSSDMVEVANQLQNLQKSRSFSLGSGVVELSEAPSIHDGNPKKVVIITEESKGEGAYKDVRAMNQKASSSARFRSQKVMQTVQNVPRCKRDDGKGWRCSQPAEDGFTMCNHHRKRSISQGQCRRKKGKLDSEPTVSAKSPRNSIYVANSRVVPDLVTTAGSWNPFLDDELAHDEHRQFLKAKSMKSLLSKPPKKLSHIRKAGYLSSLT